MCAQYEVELTATRRLKGNVTTAFLIIFLGIASFWSDQSIIFVVSVLAFLLLLLRHHYYSPESRKWVAKVAGGLLIAAVLFVAAQPGVHMLNVLLLAGGGILILLNARFYALLAAKRGRTYALAAIPFHLLFFLYSGIAFLVAVCRHFFNQRCTSSSFSDVSAGLSAFRHYRLSTAQGLQILFGDDIARFVVLRIRVYFPEVVITTKYVSGRQHPGQH